MAHDQEVLSLNLSTVYRTDVSNNANYNIKEKFKIKVAKWGTPKKKYLKIIQSVNYLQHYYNICTASFVQFCDGLFSVKSFGQVELENNRYIVTGIDAHGLKIQGRGLFRLLRVGPTVG
jgi:hypothetical protein